MTTGFQRSIFLFWEGKTSPERLGKREKRREKMEGILGWFWEGGGGVSASFLGFFWEISKGKGGEGGGRGG